MLNPDSRIYNRGLPEHSVLAIHMGDSFSRLSPLLQKSHLGRSRLSGVANVKQGNAVAKLICRVFKLPEAGQDIDLTVNCEHSSDSMSWSRNFNGKFMNSIFRRKGDHLVETLGPFALILKIVEQNGDLEYQFEKTRFFGLPVPNFLAPQITAAESEEEGRYRFSVVVTMLLVGPLISYGGLLTVESV